MKFFQVIKNHGSKDVRLFNISLFKRERQVLNATGGGVEYVRYRYRILNIPIYRTYILTEPILYDGIYQNPISKAVSLLDIMWQSQIQGVPYRGQLGQDLIAYVIFKGKKDGFFADIAAHDGVNINNTYMFEKLGWQGFCVEANPKTFETLRQNRKCDCYNVAVFSENIGKTRFAITNDATSVLDSLELTLSDAHKKRMEDSAKMNVEYIEVQTTTFNELMAHYPNVTHIDFLSLDIEGGELDVLKGIDFDKYSFGLMTIEHNFIESTKREIIDLLRQKGYRILFQNGWDIMFVKDDRIIFV
ncbi:FkbM family methyltransferase [Helicobacter saguini]|uniref:FkbM family methyltransferase n=1 Tax=Helicobacter saguini TaxID=1548018 RepID=UPI00132AEB26|nr:FkbM family methyltransferase [Helicobacter saguini]MWV62628.1 FkbM family methyltransferase [Helicobacter saguini]MWV71396.1 FkbM family methyltransferase [Helicobacter saguini]